MDKPGTASMAESDLNWQTNFVDLNGHSGSIEVPALTLDGIGAKSEYQGC